MKFYPRRAGWTRYNNGMWTSRGNRAPSRSAGAFLKRPDNALLLPSRRSKLGDREILTYPQGQFTLENGQVKRVDFPSLPPSPPMSSTAKVGAWVDP